MSNPVNSPGLSIIAAMASNRVIGLDNRMPWHLPADLKRFKAITMGKPMIMGRKTWESLPGLLPGRRHIVLTNNPAYSATGCELASSLEQAISMASHPQPEEIMIIGGANLYQQALPMSRRIYLTQLELEVQGDAFFPQFDLTQWSETYKEKHIADENISFGYSFITFEKTPEASAKYSVSPYL